jgi:uncharacterized membrane protein (UPF0136 family)
MRILELLLSVTAGILTAFLPVLAMELYGPSLFTDGALGLRVIVLATLLFAAGVCLLHPIDPLAFGATLIVAVPFLLFTKGSAYLGLWTISSLSKPLLSGVWIGVPAALCASLLKQRKPPQWTPIAFVASACLLVFFAHQISARTVQTDSTAMATRLQQVRQAEEAFAAARPDHTYTCDGSELKTPGIRWREVAQVGTTVQDLGQADGFWINLVCPAEDRRDWFRVDAFGGVNSGPALTFDSRKR